MRVVKRAQWRKRRREGKCNEGRPEESGGTFPPPLSVTHFSFLPFLPVTLRESLCIIHDFVNVACRCIFTALYLEKFRAKETRYRAASARGVPKRTRVTRILGEGHTAESNKISGQMCNMRKSGGIKRILLSYLWFRRKWIITLMTNYILDTSSIKAR